MPEPATFKRECCEIIESCPEPDVTWGEGGIDDWGWTATFAAAEAEPPRTDDLERA
jgi:hypothetical protein